PDECSIFFFARARPPRDLHSFPTRRSSDLGDGHEEDAALLDPADVRPLVVDELSLARAADGAEFQASLSEGEVAVDLLDGGKVLDRKSTRLNSSHLVISYAVFCLKKKKTK